VKPNRWPIPSLLELKAWAENLMEKLEASRLFLYKKTEKNFFPPSSIFGIKRIFLQTTLMTKNYLTKLTKV
jgi:hypothetical protein